jgi:hypothetical protein
MSRRGARCCKSRRWWWWRGTPKSISLPPPPTFIFLRVILHLHVYIYAIVSTQHAVTPLADAVRVILNEFALATDVYSYNC